MFLQELSTVSTLGSRLNFTLRRRGGDDGNIAGFIALSKNDSASLGTLLPCSSMIGVIDKETVVANDRRRQR